MIAPAALLEGSLRAAATTSNVLNSVYSLSLRLASIAQPLIVAAAAGTNSDASSSRPFNAKVCSKNCNQLREIMAQDDYEYAAAVLENLKHINSLLYVWVLREQANTFNLDGSCAIVNETLRLMQHSLHRAEQKLDTAINCSASSPSRKNMPSTYRSSYRPVHRHSRLSGDEDGHVPLRMQLPGHYTENDAQVAVCTYIDDDASSVCKHRSTASAKENRAIQQDPRCRSTANRVRRRLYAAKSRLGHACGDLVTTYGYRNSAHSPLLNKSWVFFFPVIQSALDDLAKASAQAAVAFAAISAAEQLGETTQLQGLLQSRYFTAKDMLLTETPNRMKLDASSTYSNLHNARLPNHLYRVFLKQKKKRLGGREVFYSGQNQFHHEKRRSEALTVHFGDKSLPAKKNVTMASGKKRFIPRNPPHKVSPAALVAAISRLVSTESCTGDLIVLNGALSIVLPERYGSRRLAGRHAQAVSRSSRTKELCADCSLRIARSVNGTTSIIVESVAHAKKNLPKERSQLRNMPSFANNSVLRGRIFDSKQPYRNSHCVPNSHRLRRGHGTYARSSLRSPVRTHRATPRRQHAPNNSFAENSLPRIQQSYLEKANLSGSVSMRTPRFAVDAPVVHPMDQDCVSQWPRTLPQPLANVVRTRQSQENMEPRYFWSNLDGRPGTTAAADRVGTRGNDRSKLENDFYVVNDSSGLFLSSHHHSQPCQSSSQYPSYCPPTNVPYSQVTVQVDSDPPSETASVYIGPSCDYIKTEKGREATNKMFCPSGGNPDDYYLPRPADEDTCSPIALRMPAATAMLMHCAKRRNPVFTQAQYTSTKKKRFYRWPKVHRIQLNRGRRSRKFSESTGARASAWLHQRKFANEVSIPFFSFPNALHLSLGFEQVKIWGTRRFHCLLDNALNQNLPANAEATNCTKFFSEFEFIFVLKKTAPPSLDGVQGNRCSKKAILEALYVARLLALSEKMGCNYNRSSDGVDEDQLQDAVFPSTFSSQSESDVWVAVNNEYSHDAIAKVPISQTSSKAHSTTHSLMNTLNALTDDTLNSLLSGVIL